MKRYILYFLNILLVSVFASCEEVEELNKTFDEKKNHTLTLHVNTGGMQSRTINGEDSRNENLIQSLDCFFYTSVNESAKCYKRATIPVGGFTGTQSHSVNISFEDEEMKNIFGNDYKDNGNNRTCYIYIIANRPSSITITGNETIKVLKSKTLESGFATLGNQANFVMDSGKPNANGEYVYDEETGEMREILVEPYEMAPYIERNIFYDDRYGGYLKSPEKKQGISEKAIKVNEMLNFPLQMKLQNISF